MTDSNFTTLFRLGKVSEDEIDTFIEEWAQTESDISLCDFLGMTGTQYAEWVYNPNRSLTDILQVKKGLTLVSPVL